MPEAGRVLTDGGVTVWLWRLTESERELVGLWERLQSGEALPAARSAARRSEWLAERLLIATAIGKDARLRHRPSGAPYLEPPVPGFSISHTRGMVAIAVSDKGPVGVDVERVSHKVLRVRNRFLSPEELALIADDDVTANIVAWTAKEAMFKTEVSPPLCRAWPWPGRSSEGERTLAQYTLSCPASRPGQDQALQSDGFSLWTRIIDGDCVLTVAQPTKN